VFCPILSYYVGAKTHPQTVLIKINELCSLNNACSLFPKKPSPHLRCQRMSQNCEDPGVGWEVVWWKTTNYQVYGKEGGTGRIIMDLLHF